MTMEAASENGSGEMQFTTHHAEELQAILAEENHSELGRIEQTLLTGRISGERQAPDSTNPMRLLEVEGDVAGIFKPASGERQIDPSTEPHLYKNDRATYLVDRELTFDHVPPTVIRTIDGDEGSFQQFIPNATHIEESEGELTEMILDDLYEIWMLDIITRQGDRQYGTVVDVNGHAWAIDNAVSFADGNYSQTFFSRPAPARTRRKLSAFVADSSRQERLLNDLGADIVSPAEAAASLARIRWLEEILRQKGRLDQDDNPNF